MLTIKLLTIFTLISLASGQNYLMEVVQYNYSIPQTIFRCAGALFTNRSIIVPANCLDNIPQDNIFIRRTYYDEFGTRMSMSLNRHEFKQHLNYNSSDASKNNIAIVDYLNTELEFFTPRSLSEVKVTPSFCYLHGLLERNEIERKYFDDLFTILSPEQCLSQDSHTFCAVFDSVDNPTCDFDYGSPITCDGITVAGFLISENGCEMNWVNNTGTLRVVPMLKFTSMSLYHEWMALEEETNTTTTSTTTVSTTTLLSTASTTVVTTTTLGSTTPDSATSVQLAKLGILTAFVMMILVNF